MEEHADIVDIKVSDAASMLTQVMSNASSPSYKRLTVSWIQYQLAAVYFSQSADRSSCEHPFAPGFGTLVVACWFQLPSHECRPF